MALDERAEDRRDDQMHDHVAQVWAAPIADRDPTSLFRMGAACLDLADENEDADRRAMLASIASSLLVFAGRTDGAVAGRIEELAEREQARGANEPETARVITELTKAINAP